MKKHLNFSCFFCILYTEHAIYQSNGNTQNINKTNIPHEINLLFTQKLRQTHASSVIATLPQQNSGA